METKDNKTKDNKFTATLKKMKPRDFIYPGIFLLFSLGVLVTFFLTTQFISKTINKVFYVENIQEPAGLNVQAYKLTAKKLHLKINEPGNTVVNTETVSSPAETTATSTATDKTVVR
ncbi:MAG: hypothetical protein PHS95_00135 [Candidatus Pacebacteria bacterium]|nr:hypothetical protein [Candidatus Paceibacterota bacterium]